MNAEEIEKFFSKKSNKGSSCVKINFRKRDSMFGLFIKEADYADLKSKNFWRIVPQRNLEAYQASKNVNLARIFNGAEFTRLNTYEESFDH